MKTSPKPHTASGPLLAVFKQRAALCGLEDFMVIQSARRLSRLWATPGAPHAAAALVFGIATFVAVQIGALDARGPAAAAQLFAGPAMPTLAAATSLQRTSATAHGGLSKHAQRSSSPQVVLARQPSRNFATNPGTAFPAAPFALAVLLAALSVAAAAAGTPPRSSA